MKIRNQRTSWIAFVAAGFCALTFLISTAPATLAASPDNFAATPSVAAHATIGGAVTQDTGCAPGDLCFWVDTNKGGAKGRVSGNNQSWGFPQASCTNGTWNDCASSIQNNGESCDVNVYENAGYGGHKLTIRRGDYISDLTGYWITFPIDSWNDDIQSNRWC
jgi:hypothetical protein